MVTSWLIWFAAMRRVISASSQLLRSRVMSRACLSSSWVRTRASKIGGRMGLVM